jgi:molybdenum cofactor synthesis domain-containing protein
MNPHDVTGQSALLDASLVQSASTVVAVSAAASAASCPASTVPPPALLSRQPESQAADPSNAGNRKTRPLEGDGQPGGRFGIERQCLMNSNHWIIGAVRLVYDSAMALVDAVAHPDTTASSTSSTSSTRAAILLIGNEILSGKVEEQNARYLVRELRALGVTVGRIEVIPDDAAEIAATARQLSARFDVVFSSGGVGPTHDDVTLPAMAAAFGMGMMRDPTLEALLRAAFGSRLHERDLRMADIPDGARLEYGPRGPGAVWPVVVVRNIWVLPGVPEIFRRKLDSVRELFRTAPIFGRAVYSREGEGPIAAALDAVVAEFPTVEIGSYPHPGAPDYKVKITLDGRDRAAVDAALGDLVARLGADVVRTD